MKHPVNRPIRDVVNTQLRRKITLETRADARFHVSDLCSRHNAAVVSLRSIYQAASAMNYATRLSNKRAIQHATTKYLTGTALCVPGRMAKRAALAGSGRPVRRYRHVLRRPDLGPISSIAGQCADHSAARPGHPIPASGQRGHGGDRQSADCRRDDPVRRRRRCHRQGLWRDQCHRPRPRRRRAAGEADRGDVAIRSRSLHLSRSFAHPDCSARVNLGDDPDVFDKVLGETVTRTTQAMTAGANTASSGH